MEQTLSISDDIASHVNGFAASQNIDIAAAYELLVTVGLETLGGLEMDVYVKNDKLILECPACETIFETTDDAIAHDC
jgi:hypothetical protein